jgi:hypothetical protein
VPVKLCGCRITVSFRRIRTTEVIQIAEEGERNPQAITSTYKHMKLNVTAATVLIALAFMHGQWLTAADAPPGNHQAPAVEAGTCVEHSCKLVPEMKQVKKTVYEVQELPYCLKKLPPLCSLFHHHGCACEICAECQCPRYKKVLVKKEIVCKEVCASKCVIEERRVPCQPCECCK